MSAPVLLIAYNRPLKLKALIQSLSISKPRKLLVAIDGPRQERVGDDRLVQETQQVLESINWKCDLQTRFRHRNLGLQTAYVDAVNWAIEEFGRTIIIEDDVVAGPELVPYLSEALDRYLLDDRIGHVSGYNFVPEQRISAPASRERLGVYPASYTWATWDRAWKRLDLSIDWGLNVPLRQMAQTCGSPIAAAMWRLNFRNAVCGRVDTWDYAWVASLWQHGMKVVTPNRNLATYKGFDEGTHVRSRRRVDQLEIKSVMSLPVEPLKGVDVSADEWHRRNVFRESIAGLGRNSLAALYLEIERRKRESKT